MLTFKIHKDSKTNKPYILIPWSLAGSGEVSNKKDFAIKEFEHLIETIKKYDKKTDLLSEKNKKLKPVTVHWELCHIIYQFINQMKKELIEIINLEEALILFVGNSLDFWNWYIRIGKVYPTKESLNPKIRWTFYRVLPYIIDADIRKKLEEEIANGNIKKESEAIRFRKKMEGTEIVMKKAHKAILDVLKYGDATTNEIQEKTGASYDGLRGRISEIEGLYNVKIVKKDGKYHLQK